MSALASEHVLCEVCPGEATVTELCHLGPNRYLDDEVPPLARPRQESGKEGKPQTNLLKGRKESGLRRVTPGCVQVD